MEREKKPCLGKRSLVLFYFIFLICFAFETKAIYNFMHSNVTVVHTDFFRGDLKSPPHQFQDTCKRLIVIHVFTEKTDLKIVK